MIPLKILFIILLVHWIADFVCQTDWQAKNKSTNNKALLEHVCVYILIWTFPSLYIFGYTPQHSIFILITFAAHFITDYFTSRLNTKLLVENKVHNFFVSVGFDQILHYAQLVLTYYMLVQ